MLAWQYFESPPTVMVHCSHSFSLYWSQAWIKTAFSTIFFFAFDNRMWHSLKFLLQWNSIRPVAKSQFFFYEVNTIEIRSLNTHQIGAVKKVNKCARFFSLVICSQWICRISNLKTSCGPKVHSIEILENKRNSKDFNNTRSRFVVRMLEFFLYFLASFLKYHFRIIRMHFFPMA